MHSSVQSICEWPFSKKGRKSLSISLRFTEKNVGCSLSHLNLGPQSCISISYLNITMPIHHPNTHNIKLLMRVGHLHYLLGVALTCANPQNAHRNHLGQRWLAKQKPCQGPRYLSEWTLVLQHWSLVCWKRYRLKIQDWAKFPLVKEEGWALPEVIRIFETSIWK